MKTTTTADRLKQIMQSKNLRQADIIERMRPKAEQRGIKLNRSDISQYVSGKVMPGPDKLALLAEALNVSETWLLGYDSDDIDVVKSEDGTHFMWEYKDASADPLDKQIKCLNSALEHAGYRIAGRNDVGRLSLVFDNKYGSGAIQLSDEEFMGIFKNTTEIISIFMDNYLYKELMKNQMNSNIYIEYPKPHKVIVEEE